MMKPLELETQQGPLLKWLKALRRSFINYWIEV